MPYTIYNDAVAPFPDEAEPDQVDFAVLGAGNTGVISGCGVTGNGTNMTLSVAAGLVVVGDVPVVVAGGNAVIGAASANPRWDIVYVDNTGTQQVLAGTPSSTNPVLASAFNSATQCILAAVYIPTGTTALSTSNHVVDKRRQVHTGLQRLYADNTGIALLSKISGDTTNRIKIGSDGKIVWTPGNAGTPAPQLAYDSAVSAGVGGLTGTGVFNFTGAGTGDVPMRITGVGGQTADLLHIRNSTPTVLTKVDANGILSAPNFKRGTGTPVGAVVGNVGDLYAQTDGANGATLWVKEVGNGNNTGWNAAGTTSAGLILGGGQCPTGTIVEYAGSVLPSGWLWCDGSAVSRATYANLFTAISTAWGSGDGSTTFNLPDKRGIVTAGTQSFGVNGTVGSSDRQLGATVNTVVGERNHQLTVPELPAHTHTDSGHTHQQHGRDPTGAGPIAYDTGQPLSIETVNQAAGYPNIELGFAAIQSQGGNSSHNNVQPTQLSRFIIKI